jgi:hypothetical protein
MSSRQLRSSLSLSLFSSLFLSSGSLGIAAGMSVSVSAFKKHEMYVHSERGLQSNTEETPDGLKKAIQSPGLTPFQSMRCPVELYDGLNLESRQKCARTCLILLVPTARDIYALISWNATEWDLNISGISSVQMSTESLSSIDPRDIPRRLAAHK